MDMIDKLKNIYKEWAGAAPQSVVRLTGDGSNRVYYRLSSGEGTVIGVVGTSVEENRAFVAQTLTLAHSGLQIRSNVS